MHAQYFALINLNLKLKLCRLAIGWGGHTTSGSARPSEVTVILPDGTHCMDHKIPTYTGRYAPVIGVVGKWLWLCGGEFSLKLKLFFKLPLKRSL